MVLFSKDPLFSNMTVSESVCGKLGCKWLLLGWKREAAYPWQISVNIYIYIKSIDYSSLTEGNTV